MNNVERKKAFRKGLKELCKKYSVELELEVIQYDTDIALELKGVIDNRYTFDIVL